MGRVLHDGRARLGRAVDEFGFDRSRRLGESQLHCKARQLGITGVCEINAHPIPMIQFCQVVHGQVMFTAALEPESGAGTQKFEAPGTEFRVRTDDVASSGVLRSNFELYRA